MTKSQIGVVGLGVMGSNLSLNLAANGFTLSVYNRSLGNETDIVPNFLELHKHIIGLSGYTTLKDFVSSLCSPRKIIILVKAGEAVDEVINELTPFLDRGDILIDGGNSFYEDTIRRQQKLANNQIEYVGCGVSGGAQGARFGPSLMVGSSKRAYDLISPILNKIAAKDKQDLPTSAHIGPGGSGHFAKMIHNGIEYAEMQLLAELYAILKSNMTNEAIAFTMESWNKNELKSYLLEITITILRTKIDGFYLIDLIRDEAASKGTGYWSVREAMQMSVPTTMMSSALYARFISAFYDKRQILSSKQKDRLELNNFNLENCKDAYQFARIINHQQGFFTLLEASKTHGWHLNLSEIARIWTNGCIIKSNLMEQLHEHLKDHEDLFNGAIYLEKLNEKEESTRELITQAMQLRIPADCFWSAYSYFLSMTSSRLPANLIQAQRDYFGGHTFKRLDKPYEENFSHNWNHND